MTYLMYGLRLVFAFALIISFLGPMSAFAQSDQRCFPETGQCIDGRFRQFWEQNGGLPVFGFPLAHAADEPNRDTGATYQTQWFERNRLELHPENHAPYDVLLGRLGEDLMLHQGRRWQDEPRGAPQQGCLWFAETGHSMCDSAPGLGFMSYWQNHGLQFDGQPGYSHAESLALFGLPLTEPEFETNSSGDRVLTQWFERARFEWHPDQPDQYKVLLGLLGSEARTALVAHANPGLPGHLLILADTVYNVRADGSEVMPLIYPTSGINIIVSPDGSMVAFGCSKTGQPGLCIAHYDGSDVQQIVNDTSVSLRAWSPDGTRISYVSGQDDRRGLRIIGVDGSEDRLLFAATPDRMVSSPSWSPDGTHLVFNTLYSETAVYVVNADGSGLNRIVAQGEDAQWSPVAQRIVFESTTSGNEDLYAIDPDGTKLQQLTNTPDGEGIPTWSPDGSHIAYRWQKAVEPNPAGAPTGIFVIPAGGGEPVRALYTEPVYYFFSPIWSPDSAYVAASRFCTRLCGPGQTLGARADGTSPQFLMVESAKPGVVVTVIAWR